MGRYMQAAYKSIHKQITGAGDVHWSRFLFKGRENEADFTIEFDAGFFSRAYQRDNATEKVTVEAHSIITAPEFIPSSELEEEEETEQHVRVERSPGWRRRFRVRVRKPIRKIGRAVRKTVKKVKHGVKTVGRKIGKGVKKAVSKVKSGVKKLAAKTKAAIKKAGSKLRGAVKKAKEKIKSNVRRLKTKIKKVVRIPGDLAKKLRDKLMSL